MSKKISEDKLKISLDANGVIETALEWEVENKVWVLNIMSFTLPVQCSMLHCTGNVRLLRSSTHILLFASHS